MENTMVIDEVTGHEYEVLLDEDGDKCCIFGCGKVLDDWDHDNSCRECE